MGQGVFCETGNSVQRTVKKKVVGNQLMYKLIIVEDENIVRSGLEHGTDWAGLGFEVAGTATNGIEALKLVEQCNPDVVLTDIRMPDMNGIELMRILRNQYADIEIVILSGYSDFEYARSAVKYQAYEYLTKPIDEQELIRTFQSIKQKIRSKRQEFYSQKESENGPYRVDRDKLRDVFLSTFMRKPLDEEFIRKSLEELDIQLNEKCYCIAVMQLDFDNQSQILKLKSSSAGNAAKGWRVILMSTPTKSTISF